jgi:hypothetical protein
MSFKTLSSFQKEVLQKVMIPLSENNKKLRRNPTGFIRMKVTTVSKESIGT